VKTGKLTIKGTVQKSWQKIYETTLGSSATSVTISSLDGDTDVEYKLVTRLISGGASNGYTLRLNNDSGTNYGFQRLVGESTTVSANQYTARDAIYIDESLNNANDVSCSEFLIFAKSGYIRPVFRHLAGGITGTTVTTLRGQGAVWSNTANNLTSLVIASLISSGLGVGSYIALYRRRA